MRHISKFEDGDGVSVGIVGGAAGGDFPLQSLIAVPNNCCINYASGGGSCCSTAESLSASAAQSAVAVISILAQSKHSQPLQLVSVWGWLGGRWLVRMQGLAYAKLCT